MVDAKGADYIEQLDLISVWLPEGEEQPPIGSLVRYTIEPEIMASYPPQARAISLEIIEEESKPVKTSLDIAVRIREHQPSDTVILDVRTPEEFSQGHVAEAVNLPLAELNDETLSHYDGDATLIVYCRSGTRSASAARILDEAEFKVVIDAGGINSYSGEKVVE